MNRKQISRVEFSHKLAQAIKTKYDPLKGSLGAYINLWLRAYHITDLEQGT